MASLQSARYQRGLTIFEVTLIVIMLGVLMVIFMEKTLRLDVQGERIKLDAVIAQLRSAVAIEFVNRVVHEGGIDSTLSLRHDNPMRYLQITPPDYLGELAQAPPGGVGPGVWYFDRQDQVLVYTVRNGAYFRSALEGGARARFVLELVYSDVNRNARFDRGVDRINGVDVIPLERFDWLSEARTQKE